MPTRPDEKRRRPAAPPGDEQVDEASKESFPASDPPNWTLGPPKDEPPPPDSDLRRKHLRRSR